MLSKRKAERAICRPAIRAFISDLGKRTKIDSLVITWPSGQVDHLTNVPIDQIIAVKEGTGIVPHPFPKVASTKWERNCALRMF